MTRRWLVRSVAAMVAVSWLSPALAAGQESAPTPEPAKLRTSWGDPDLQGIWSYATFTPLQRPGDLAGRQFLTPEEVAEQNLADATRATSERRGELSRERDLALAYNQVWWDRGTSTGRTSLIVDPPGGRLPLLTPEAERRQAALRDYRRDHAYDSWEDRPLQERCMTYQRVPPVPSGYSNTYHIFQSPGQVAILNEMIHDVRVVPLDGRAPIDGRIRQWNGDSRGRWDGDTLVVETTHYRDDTTWRGFRHPRPARGRAVHPPRRRHHRVPVHDSRRGDLHPPVHRRAAPHQPAGLRHLRVRVSRRELLDRQRAGRRARRGGRGR